MLEQITSIKEDTLEAIAGIGDLKALDDIRVGALGKKGAITGFMKQLGGLDPDERREVGQELNRIKDAVQAAIDTRKSELEWAALNERLETERVDVSLPPRPETQGSIHPVSQVMDEIMAIFCEMDFAIAEGPDIEDDWLNFGALNIPDEHPARQEHDTFYLPSSGEGGRPVLRTHTSPVQIRHMMKSEPPIRIIAPGRTYRSDSDMTHTPMFHQVEGLVIDETAHLGHLKGCLRDFVEAFFQVDNVPMRFRPSYFPFTAPSMEVDIGCSFEGGELKIGAGDDWLEILGSGMVHPNVLRNGGIDPDRYQGFAFGMGIDRIAMLKYGIPDLRSFFDADLRWLRHYGFRALDLPTLHGGLAR
ncbi:MAG: phenylalanine--tRNA ligase subunit alpha [Rhodospirillaceae bacterium]|nr:phenylalanine--tRNA ligase subunit alpha [Rhodospirillaceae bacterium]|tara:strand:+ start:27174 stop:28253 length:1080 start_codon:yes stop_codon:yes gene_type:complete